MPNQPKGINTEERELRYSFTERLIELIDETGGDEKFAKKLNKIQLKGFTNAKVLKDWKDPEKDIQLRKIYLIAKACDVSIDWLLGLSVEKTRSRRMFKYPSTYGDVLSILNDLIKMEVIIIIEDISHKVKKIVGCYNQTNEEINTDNYVTIPQYIRIEDGHLIDLFKDLYRSQGLMEKEFADAWKKMLILEPNKPLQKHNDNPDYNGVEFGRGNDKETAVSAEFLDDNALKKHVAEQLGKLKNDLSDTEFGNKIGVPKSTVNGWLNPNGPLPQTYHLYKIAKEYNVPADRILCLEEYSCAAIPWEDKIYTYGSILSMLKDLIDKGTIGFVQEYDPYDCFDNPDDGCNDDYAPVIEDHLVIDDPFLFSLLLSLSKLKQYSTKNLKKILEEPFNKYKDYPLLSFKKDTKYGSYKSIRNDLGKILHNAWDGNIEHNIDFDKLYKDLQMLRNPKSEK